MPDEARNRAVLTDLALRRGPGKTFCPSEAARALAADWRPLMPEIRRVAAEMQRQGRLRATRKGARVDPDASGGAIRLGLPQR